MDALPLTTIPWAGALWSREIAGDHAVVVARVGGEAAVAEGAAAGAAEDRIGNRLEFRDARVIDAIGRSLDVVVDLVGRVVRPVKRDGVGGAVGEPQVRRIGRQIAGALKAFAGDDLLADRTLSGREPFEMGRAVPAAPLVLEEDDVVIARRKVDGLSAVPGVPRGVNAGVGGDQRPVDIEVSIISRCWRGSSNTLR